MKVSDFQLKQALDSAGWDVAAAAKAVGLSYQAVHRRLDKIRSFASELSKAEGGISALDGGGAEAAERPEPEQVKAPEPERAPESPAVVDVADTVRDHGGADGDSEGMVEHDSMIPSPNGLRLPVSPCNVEITSLIPKPYPDFIEKPSWQRLLTILDKTALNVYYMGEAGSGKTLGIQEAAARHGLPLLNISCEREMLPTELFGRVQASGASTYFQETLMPRMMREPCVIYFDELNFADSRLLSTLHKLLEEREVYLPVVDKVYRAHEGVRFVASGNPSGGKYGGTGKLNTALVTRFGAVLQSERLDQHDIKMLLFNIKPKNPKASDPSDLLNELDDDNRALVKKTALERLPQFLLEAQALVIENDLRAEISFRTIKAVKALWEHFTLWESLEMAVCNPAFLSASLAEYRTFEGLASSIFSAHELVTRL